MSDPVRDDFSMRLQRLDTMTKKGLGMEAPGTLGRSHYRVRQRRVPLLTPLITLVFGLYGLKALLFHGVGLSVYQARILDLRAGNLLEQLIAVLMQPDPLTRALSQVFSALGF